MSSVSTFALGGESSKINNPTIVRYTIAVVNTEELITLPSNTKAFRLQNVGSRIIRFAYATGEIAAGRYYSLYPFAPITSLGIINQTNLTIYLRSPGIETVEIEIWM